MTQEIEIHEVKIVDDRIHVDYTIFETRDGIEIISNIKQQIRPLHVANFIEEKGINEVYYDYAPDELVVIPTSLYIVENLREVVKLYLEYNLAA